MVNFRRSKQAGGTYFFTLTLRDRKSRILIEHIDELRDALKIVKKKMPYKSRSIVVLPDHLHTIWELPAGDVNYSVRWRRIKSIFTQSILSLGVRLSKDKRGECNLWQRRFWEHTIRNDIDLEKHLNYIHYNPVKHGYVKNVIDWPYSSFHNYVSSNLLPFNWGGEFVEDEESFGE